MRTCGKQLAAIKLREAGNELDRNQLLLHQVKVALDIIEGVVDSSQNQR
jgi:hypothetical protein